MFGLDLQMGRELLFVPAAGSAVRILNGGFSASLAQILFHYLPGGECTSTCPGMGVAGP